MFALSTQSIDYRLACHAGNLSLIPCTRAQLDSGFHPVEVGKRKVGKRTTVKGQRKKSLLTMSLYPGKETTAC